MGTPAHDVSETSALVLLWTDRSLYGGRVAGEFLRRVNLGAGERLKGELEELVGHVGEEVCNRKHAVRELSSRFLASSPDAQAVFLGAGLDPRPLEAAESFPGARVFDVDAGDRGAKASLAEESGAGGNVAFCGADVGDPGALSEELARAGWDRGRATLVVAEGITYYVDKGAFARSLGALRTPGGGLVLEYAVPDEDVEEGDREAYAAFFARLRERLGLPWPLRRYSVREAEALVGGLGGRVESTLGQGEMEKARTGRLSTYGGRDGAVRVTLARF